MKPENFFINSGLYQKFIFDSSDSKKLIEEIVNFSGTIDTYCVACKKKSIFQYTDRSTNFSFNNILEKEYFTKVFECSRNNKHKLIFFYRVTTYGFEKIGQYPSIASLENNNISRYKSVLKKDYKELNKAIGLFSLE